MGPKTQNLRPVWQNISDLSKAFWSKHQTPTGYSLFFWITLCSPLGVNVRENPSQSAVSELLQAVFTTST